MSLLRHLVGTLTLLLCVGAMCDCDKGVVPMEAQTRPRPASIEPGESALIGKLRELKTIAEVTSLLGAPLREDPLYEPKIKSPKRVGSTYTFQINDALVRIRTDLEGTILRVESDDAD